MLRGLIFLAVVGTTYAPSLAMARPPEPSAPHVAAPAPAQPIVYRDSPRDDRHHHHKHSK